MELNMFLNQGKFNDTINEFCNIFKYKLPHCNHKILISNIKSLKIEETYDTTYDGREIKENGMYWYDNRITLYNANILKIYGEDLLRGQTLTLKHELLHMATTYKQGNVVLSGFSQSSQEKSFGTGLNEGYTELINIRYFSNDKTKVSYPQQTFIAQGIEDLIGRDKMEQLYFCADLNGLMKELNIFMSDKDINMLIDLIDSCNHSEKSDKQAYLGKAAYARLIIADAKRRHHYKQLQEGKISKEEYDFYDVQEFLFLKGYRLVKEGDLYTVITPDINEPKRINQEQVKSIMEYYLTTEVPNRSFIMTDTHNVDDPFLNYCQSIVTDTKKTELNRMFEDKNDSEKQNQNTPKKKV